MVAVKGLGIEGGGGWEGNGQFTLTSCLSAKATLKMKTFVHVSRLKLAVEVWRRWPYHAVGGLEV